MPRELRNVEGAVIIDVRSPDEFASGHVVGAINIPLDSLAAQTAALPKEAVLVTVCGKGGGLRCARRRGCAPSAGTRLGPCAAGLRLGCN